MNYIPFTGQIPLIVFAAMALVPASALMAQQDRAGGKNVETEIGEFEYPNGTGTDLKAIKTEKDLPGSFHRYYGQYRNQFRDQERRIARIDLDADLNYDGTIDNSDPADSGAFEQTPPGLVIGEGESSKFIIRLTPYRVDYEGAAVVTMEVVGINRGDKTGEFASLDEEIAQTSQVRVWADAGKRKLLLDSQDPARRWVEWSIESESYPANIPNIVPRTVYVEGVSANGSYPGDCRVLVTVSHRGKNEAAPPVEYGGKTIVAPEKKEENKFFKRFRTSFDHILVTVTPEPQHKEFINNNAESVWISGNAPSRK